MIVEKERRGEEGEESETVERACNVRRRREMVDAQEERNA